MKDYKVTIMMPHLYRVQANDEHEASLLKDEVMNQITKNLDPKPYCHSIVEIEEEIPQTA